eukprot:gene3781-701_t
MTLTRIGTQTSGALRAASMLHNKMICSLLGCPLAFYDSTPSGVILNRVNKDMQSIDYNLRMTENMFLYCLLHSIGVLLIVTVVTPMFLVALVILGGVYYYVQRRYRNCACEVKRLDGITRSPIYSACGETVDGISTLRAHQQTQQCLDEFLDMLDRNARAFWVTNMLNRWLGLRLELIGASAVGSAALFAVLSTGYVAPAFLGISLTYALDFTNTFGWLTRMIVEYGTLLTSVERVIEKTEGLCGADLMDWPSDGAIQFSKVCMRYRPELPLVLDSVSFKIDGGTRLGIAGRTGSGKSTLIACLFRVVNIESGSLLIDGIEASSVALERLRSHMAIIPQDPTFFSGTVRMNLDPESRHTDEAIIKALERASVLSAGGLDADIVEGGNNFSVGEKQLLSLARALLLQSKIILMDEATANVDAHTDQLIQQCIRSEFIGSTIITIAHRIGTILDYDNILVLDDGKVSEFGPPDVLLSSGGVFEKLASHNAAPSCDKD